MTSRRLVALLVLPMLMLVSPASFAQQGRAAAEALVRDFFDALVLGDTAALESIMGGPLLERRKLLLSNPTYPDHLRQTYTGAQLTIESIERTGQGEFAVDASMLFGTDENTYYKRFLVRREAASADGALLLKIHDEAEPGEGNAP